MLKKPSNKKTVQNSKETKSYKWNLSQLKWLEALESGKYKRCTAELCHLENGKESFCCLGVGAELLCKKSDIEDVIDGEYRKYEGEATYAPTSVIKKLKLNCEQGRIKTEEIKGYRREESTLAQLNDSGMSFKKIAEFIRKYPNAVFKS